MSYVDNVLVQNEKIIYRTKPNIIVFLTPIFILLLAVAVYIFGMNSSLGDYPLFGKVHAYDIAAVILVAFGLYQLTISAIIFKTAEYALTNKRVIMKIGLFYRDAIEISLSKIESINMDQSILGRILGYGTIVVVGTGGSRDPYTNIDKPLEFVRHVRRALAE